ncbi:hypothetical protein F4680DRAFT_339495 [Xylaria scruposa]|nr:hypothetical protein F4680DRAFT_339495 [Xylaria scruposa]
MADTRVLTRLISTWTSFGNTTITVPITSTALSTTSDASSSLSITLLPTPTISTTIPPPTSFPSAVSSSGIFSPSSSTLDLSTTSSLGIPTAAFSSSSTISYPTESIPDPPIIPIPISSSSLPTSSVASATISDTSISRSTSNLPSFPSSATTPLIPYPTPVDVSSPLFPPTQPNPIIPTPDPTSGSAPPPGDHRTPPILMIIAIVISIFIFILLVTLLILRQLALRQHAQRRAIEIPVTGSSSHSMASTYHSAHRGEVRVVIERPLGEARLWPVPPGHPSHYYAEPGIVAEREESGAADPNQWSVTSQDGSNSLPETRTGMGWGRASARIGVGRAY